jgi:hypothetical protein
VSSAKIARKGVLGQQNLDRLDTLLNPSQNHLKRWRGIG